MGWWADKIRAENPRLVRGQPHEVPGWTQQPREPEPQLKGPEDQVVIDNTLKHYADVERPERTGKHVALPMTPEERFWGPREYRTWNGQKVAIPGRSQGDIINVPRSTKTWEHNSWKVQTDVGMFGDATPQELAAVNQQRVRDEYAQHTQIYREVAKNQNAGIYDSANARQPNMHVRPIGY